MNRCSVSVLLAGCLLVVSACGGASAPASTRGSNALGTPPGGQPTVTTASMMPAASNASAAPSVGVPSASPRLSSSPTAGREAVIPASWTIYTWRDPAGSIALPPGWTTMDLATGNENPSGAAASGAPHLTERSYRRVPDPGSYRLVADGPLPGGSPTGVSVTVTVETGDASLAAFVARLTETYASRPDARRVSTRDVTTPIGPGVELRYSTEGAGGPGTELDTAVFLPDRRSLEISIETGWPADDFGALATSILATLHSQARPVFSFPPGPAANDPAAAIAEAARRLGALRSYRFVATVLGRSLTQLDQGIPGAFTYYGTLDRSGGLAIDGVLGLFMGEGNGSGAGISSGYELTVSPDWVWMTGPNGPEKYPATSSEIVTMLAGFLPESIVGRVVIPFATAYERVGEQEHNGVRAVHFAATPAGLARYAAATGLSGDLSADVWVAVDGGYLVGVTLHGVSKGTPVPSGQAPDEFRIQVDVTNANDPVNVVHLPG